MDIWEYKFLTGAFPWESHGIPIVKFIDGKEMPDWRVNKVYMLQALNQLGQEGWELAEVIWRDYEFAHRTGELKDPVYILKRRIR